MLAILQNLSKCSKDQLAAMTAVLTNMGKGASSSPTAAAAEPIAKKTASSTLTPEQKELIQLRKKVLELEVRNLNREWSVEEITPVRIIPEKRVPRSRSPTSERGPSLEKDKRVRIQVVPNDSPFCREILEEPMEKVKMRSCRYNGTTTPESHMSAFNNHMVLYTMTDSVWCKAFPPTLEGLAAEWYGAIPKCSVYSYSQLKRMFMEHFITLVDRTKMTTELMSLVQGKDEPLREFITKFNKEAETIPNMSQEVALLAMKSGLLPRSPFRAYMGRKSLKKLAEAHEFITVDETDREMLGRKAPGDPVKRLEVTRAENTPKVDQPSKDEQTRREADKLVELRRSGRFDQYTPLTHSRSHIFSVNKADDKWQRPPRMVNRNRDTSKWCDFHRDHGHTTEECTHLKYNIEDLVRKGYLNQFK
ncbi:uncharacterized protein LOC110699129 [Chenopodium quinoa]|uniref:uncharacterized protein LOC110699129 n=1 Tax=Chenopodium quinoa TaxID=63459 RepID=UPI000B76C7E9|nr:uncharacterized protein LOC110699129 [Chenopodium quinoa]